MAKIYLVLLICLAYSNLLSLPSEEFQSRSVKKDKHPLLIKAETFYKARNFEKTISACLEGLRKLDVSSNFEEVVLLKNILGSAYINKRQFDKAIECLNEGLSLVQVNPNSHPPLLAESHYQLGVYYDQIGAGSQSLQHHNEALLVRLKHFGENHIKVAESFNGLGEVYMYTILDSRKARSQFQRSVRIFENNLNPDSYELYVAYFNMASASRRLGDTDRALTYAFKVLSIIHSKIEYQDKLERCLTLIGNIYYQKTEYVKAIEFMTKAIDQSIAIDGYNNYQLILKYLNLGLAYIYIDQPTKAISCFKKSISINSLQRQPNLNVESDNFRYLGITFQKSGQLDSAFFYLKRCYVLLLKSNGHKNIRTSEALGYLAKWFQRSNNPDSAAIYIQKALMASVPDFNQLDIHYNPDIKTVTNYEYLFSQLADKGSILLDLYLAHSQDLKILESSLASFKIADQLMELNRNTYQRDESKLFFADHYHTIYEKALAVAYLLFQKTQNETYVSDALMFMEKIKHFYWRNRCKKRRCSIRPAYPTPSVIKKEISPASWQSIKISWKVPNKKRRLTKNGSKSSHSYFAWAGSRIRC